MTNPLRTLLLAVTAIGVVHAPIAASAVIFASRGVAPGPLPAGEQRIDSGVVQMRLADGTLVSIVGPATFQVGAGGQLTVASGSFTAIAPQAGGQPILAGDGVAVPLAQNPRAARCRGSRRPARFRSCWRAFPASTPRSRRKSRRRCGRPAIPSTPSR